MPAKRVSLAAGLKAQGSMAKSARATSGSGPLLACVRRWGGTGWVFEGPVTMGMALLS